MSRDGSGDDPSTEESFVTRWSRRKHAAQQAQAPEPPEPTIDVPEAVESEVEVPVLTDADMPPIESLDEQSDYSGFLSPGVSEELRRLALRKLFRQSRFNVRDGLDDYDDDFTSFAKLGDIVTADMRHLLEQAAKREQAATDVLPGGEQSAGEATLAVESGTEPQAPDAVARATMAGNDESRPVDVEEEQEQDQEQEEHDR